MTIREALQEANKKIDTLDSLLLLAESLGINRTKLLSMCEEQIDDKIVKNFYSLVERRKNGECVAYITGKKEFWGLDFLVNKNVLVPRPETEILVETAINFLTANRAKTKKKVLDLCTGSGAIAIALKHEIPELEVCASDISPEAIKTAKKNAKRLLPNKNKITFLQGDLYNALIPHSSFLIPHYSLIASNPPYIPKAEIKALSPEVQNEPHLALNGGKTGLEIIERIITDAPNYLRRGGYLLLEADPRQMKEIENILANRGFKDIIIHKDLAGLDRVIGGKIE